MRTGMTGRAVVDDVLGRGMTREIWTGNYEKALPVSVQDFDLTAVLPAVFYMFRFALRRGKGRFIDVFGATEGTSSERRRAATIERVASRLAEAETLEGFEGETGQAILGDLLLCFCLENTKHALGRTEQDQRVAPVHYMASWVDLPEKVAHLRYIPEMIVAMLANQQGDTIKQNHEGDRTWFAAGWGFENNVLLHAFYKDMDLRGEISSRTSDHFKEGTGVGLDQLLMIRLAQQLGSAPDKLRGKEGDKISNQRPIAERAARYFSEDIRLFIRAYSTQIPRHSFVELLESCMAVGLTSIITSVVELLFEWVNTGKIRKKCDQAPASLFVDCSNGINKSLRRLAEQSMDDFMRRIERFPVVLMALRLLDYGARYDSNIRKLGIPTRPYATEWLNLLGDLLNDRREEAHAILYDLERKANELAERLENEDYPDQAQLLRDDNTQPNPVWRLAEALTSLQGRGNTQGNLIKMFDSALLIGRPNGLAAKRRVSRSVAGSGTRRTRFIRSLTFTDSVLDYLVHRHVLQKGRHLGFRPLALKSFLDIIHDRYGFCVDRPPNGMTISNELLQQNRCVLERRLRDLGLLVGVNDAEAMKCLHPRFEPAMEDNNAVD